MICYSGLEMKVIKPRTQETQICIHAFLSHSKELAFANSSQVFQL